MIPAELDATVMTLPPSEDCPIVVITGGEVRHDRFALRIQSEFPGLVVAWFRVVPSTTAHGSAEGRFGRARSRASRVIASVARNLKSPAGRARIVSRLRDVARQSTHAPRQVGQRLAARLGPEPLSQRAVELQLFGDEITRLRRARHLEPRITHNPNGPEMLALMRSLDPYFILTLGGAVYGRELRQCARGLAINQHDGWCPEYRGSYTVNWALYHRDLSKVANTVHVLTDGMDSGPILRRSTACLVEDDTPESSFARSVALGTELMCEAVRELMETRKAVVFPQPQFTGFTYLGRHLTEEIMDDIRRDLRRDLIKRDIAARMAF